MTNIIKFYHIFYVELPPAAAVTRQVFLLVGAVEPGGVVKLALNGTLTIGMLDGANIEIRDRVGAGNLFIFGLGADEPA